MSDHDPLDLQRFLDAQAPVIERVRAELAAGRKQSHWMWFVFPQIAGLGLSPMARRYAITSPAEARAYLAHPILGARLKECTGIVLAIQGRGIRDIFFAPDDLKFRSCMTLFAAAEPNEPMFAAALQKYFAGAPDAATLEMLSRLG